MDNTVLSFAGVAFAYESIPILEGVHFSLQQGSITALMGASGSGKSTLLMMAMGLLTPSEGSILRSYRRAAILFQDPCLLPWRSALENVAFALKADGLPGSRRREKAASMLQIVGLGEEDFGKFPRQLSGGMRRRVALARALVVEPDLLLLDEPFSALDAVRREQLMHLVQSQVCERSITALFVTHDEREAKRIAQSVLVLSGQPSRLMNADMP